MKPKTTKITYWIVTGLFAAFMIFSGVTELMLTEQGKEIMIHLGYPVYLLYILGVAKILGAIAIVQTKFRTIKEWAYAGFTIDILGAAASMLFVGDGILASLFTLAFLAVMFVSYFMGKRVESMKASAVPAN